MRNVFELRWKAHLSRQGTPSSPLNFTLLVSIIISGKVALVSNVLQYKYKTFPKLSFITIWYQIVAAMWIIFTEYHLVLVFVLASTKTPLIVTVEAALGCFTNCHSCQLLFLSHQTFVTCTSCCFCCVLYRTTAAAGTPASYSQLPGGSVVDSPQCATQLLRRRQHILVTQKHFLKFYYTHLYHKIVAWNITI